MPWTGRFGWVCIYARVNTNQQAESQNTQRHHSVGTRPRSQGKLSENTEGKKTKTQIQQLTTKSEKELCNRVAMFMFMKHKGSQNCKDMLTLNLKSKPLHQIVTNKDFAYTLVML